MLDYLSRYLGDLWAAINWVAANRRKVPRASRTRSRLKYQPAESTRES
jgi:hypothetical protein